MDNKIKKQQRRRQRLLKKEERRRERLGKEPDLIPYAILLHAPEHVAAPQMFKLIHENRKMFKQKKLEPVKFLGSPAA